MASKEQTGARMNEIFATPKVQLPAALGEGDIDSPLGRMGKYRKS
jgi:hypothetical protein